MYLLAAVSITLLGYKVPTEVLYLLVALAGASTIGTQIVSLAYAGQFYPMAVRGTGIGWALGVGRIGAIMAPIVIGVLVGMAMPLQQNFVAIALPGLIAAIAISLIDHRRSASAHHQHAAANVSGPLPGAASART
jgi:AAHS family benzoate transporter-like MFS transporter